jgi:hypothetical protein
MPFIKQEDRKKSFLTYSQIPGERCYAQYKDMMAAWIASPRWATVDAILANYIPDQLKRAEFLAFLVFFNLHVIPYEEMKRKENGDIC